MMCKRHLFFFSLMAVAFLMASGIPTKSQYTTKPPTPQQRLIAGRNVNMVSGTTLPGGDPYLQRQNEPSIAVSTRNPLHLLAGANDYRTVDIPITGEQLPGQEEKKIAAVPDAWLGLFKSFDRGQSWTSTLLPGFRQDLTPEGKNSPLKYNATLKKGYLAAADPVVRSGPSGLFFFSGIAFNRTKFAGRVNSAVFVSRFIDNNNIEGGDPIKYLDTAVVADDKARAELFVDKPWLAVDVPKKYPPSTIRLDGQKIPAFNVYVAYSVFTEIGNQLKSEIIFRRSTNCGQTWETPLSLSRGHILNQAAIIAIDPRENGKLYVAWRRFDSGRQKSAIIIVRSSNDGKTFDFTKEVATLPSFPQGPFDQPSTAAYPVSPLGSGFRTNSYPALAVDAKGTIYLAWAQRGYGPAGEARILMTTSRDGYSWKPPAPIDSLSFILGHQFMPSLTFASGKLTMVWYDQRDDYCGQFYGFGNWIRDDQLLRHTIDVWAAQADTSNYPYLKWTSTQVSRYIFSLGEDLENPGTYTAYQAQFNPPNFPLFALGTMPFHGDYIDVAPSPMFVLDTSGRWRFNTQPSDNPLFHVSWTDNRDVRPPSNGNWVDYVPPDSTQSPEYVTPGRLPCQGGQKPGMRNQNIYTAQLTTGVEVGSPTNVKTLDLSVPRAFVVFVKNSTELLRSFRLTIAAQPVGGQASFLQFELLDNLDVSIAPYSTISRQVFVSSTNQRASVRVNIDEIDTPGGTVLANGINSYVLLNGDPSSPAVVIGEETHQPEIENPHIRNWVVNPDVLNPRVKNEDIINDDIVNPNIINLAAPDSGYVNPNIVNADIFNPHIRNTDAANPSIVNPHIRNAGLEGLDITNVTDVEWPVKNAGNTTSSFTFKIIAQQSLPEGIYAQLIVYKVYLTPAVAGEALQQNNGVDGCELKLEPHHEILLNVINPNIINSNIINPNIENPHIRNAAIENATFVLDPGEEAIVNLRVIETSQAQTSGSQLKTLGKSGAQGFELPFNIESFVESVGGAVTSQSVDSQDAAQGIEVPPAAATILLISTASLPPGAIGLAYPSAPYTADDATLKAVGGTAPYSWWANPTDLPPGLTLSPGTGQIYGTPLRDGTKTYPFTYHFTAQVTDTGNPPQSNNQALSITIQDPVAPPAPLTIRTLSPLPVGTERKPYGATLEASGGSWPYVWTLVSGSLPSGLSLDSGGFISGTPGASGEFNFRVRVTDSSSPVKIDERDFSLTIHAYDAPTFTISGTVTIGAGATPLPGVLMRGLPGVPTTDGSGFYSDNVPEGWSGTVMPFKAGYDFVPSERTYTNVTAPYDNQNYSVNPVELDHFEFSAIGGQAAGIPFSITITAKNSQGKTVITYLDPNILSDTTGTVSPTSTGAFINGVWTGEVSISRVGQGVKIMTSGGGKAGQSNPFNVSAGAASSIRIEDRPDGTGADVNTMTISPGYNFTVYAVSRDLGNNFIDNVPVAWSLTDTSGGVVDGDLVPAADNKSATFTGHAAGTAKIRAQHASLGFNTTGIITVTETLPDDIYEPNNSFAGAATITPGTYTNLVLKDEDWFKVNILPGDAGKTLKVHIKGTAYPNPAGGRDLDFYVLNSAGKMLSYNISGSDDETAYIPNLTPGYYYIAQIYINQPGTVYSLSVEVGDTFGLGYVEGRVTDENNQGIENVNVELYGEPFDWNICRPLVTTDANGYYRIGFTPGNYTVRFNLQYFSHADPIAVDVNYLGKQYPGIVAIAAGTTVSGIDAKLVKGGTIAGRVTDSTGNPLGNSIVNVFAGDAARFAAVRTDQNGNYLADRLSTGNYKVEFRPAGGVPGTGIEWYGGMSSFGEGLPVPVQAGATTPGIDAQLDIGGSVSGRVTDMAGNPVQGVQVSALDVAGMTLWTVSTDQFGNYGIGRLPACPVKVFFNASTAAGNYVSEYYPDKLLIGEADPVLVQAGQNTSGIDAQLAVGGTITGRVTDTNGKALSGISVMCIDIDTDRYNGATTDANGNYTIRNVFPDDYKLRFRPNTGNLAVEWYNNATSFTAGTIVPVAAGQTITDINAQLADNGGFISGKVTVDGSIGIENVRILVYDSAKKAVISSGMTGPDGSYSVPRIPTCQAKVFFDADLGYLNYASEYYNDQSLFDNATPVPATLGQTFPGVEAVLAPRPALAITTTSLPSGEMGVSYTTSLQASGGREFYYWSVLSGSLPPGLTLNGSGVIRGVPAASGTFNFTVRVIDSTSPQQYSDKPLTLIIQGYVANYIVQGTITLSGSRLQGVVMNGFPGNPVTDSSGQYTATVPAGWSGTVTPTLTGYAFTPANRTYTTVASSYQNQDYSATGGNDISGTVTTNGSPRQGILLAGLPGNPRTDIHGFYTASVPSGWSGTVTPTVPGFSFVPGNRTYAGVNSAQPGQDYVASYVGNADDAFEPNNSYDQAKPVVPGTYTDLVLQDDDWFKVYVSAADVGKILKVHIKGTAYPWYQNERFDLDFYVVNRSRRLLSYNYSGSDDETAYITDLAEGWYYIGQSYIGNLGTVYSLSVEIGTNFGIGFISGRVTDYQGRGVENVNIELYRDPADWNISFPMITTGPGGYYKIGFAPGNYTVRFNLYNFYHRDAWAKDVNYIGKQYPGIISIIAGATVAGIDAQLAPGGAISGRVTDSNGNGLNSLAAVFVYSSDGVRASLAYTDSNGNYVAERLRTGNYKVRFRNPLNYNFYQWYGNAFSFEDGFPIAVHFGEITPNIDAQLGDWPSVEGYVEGHVTDMAGNPIQGVGVTAYEGTGVALASASTDQSGFYHIRRLSPGLVKIFFNASTVAGNYVSEYYPDKLLIGEASPVAVQAGQTTTGKDAQLAAGGTVTGHVADPLGNALSGAGVSLFNTASDLVYRASADTNGNYTLANLAPGTYKARFTHPQGNYALKWYNTNNPVNSFTEGSVVTVTAGETFSGINAQFSDRGGSISGKVMDGNGIGIEGVLVTARDSAKQADIGSVFSAADGSYAIRYIPVGPAKIYLNADSSYLNYVSEYYNDKSSLEGADPVNVNLNETTANINATLSPGPSLTIATSSIPNGEVATLYTVSLQASGGRTFYYWSVISGVLPSGLYLDSRGVISGTPTATGTFIFTARVADSTSPQQKSATRDYTINIGSYTGTGYLISGKVMLGGSPLPGVMMQGLPGPPATNSSGEYIVAVTPGWSGSATPTRYGYLFSPPNQTYSNVSSHLAGQDYAASLAPLQITTSGLPDGAKNAPYNTQLQAAFGVAPYSWSVISGSLPGGLTLNSGGTISGTPTDSGGFPFVVRVTDSKIPQQSATQSFNLYVAPALQGAWTTNYPFGGSMYQKGLAIDPADSNVLYATAENRGIFKSTDAGMSWTNLTDDPNWPFGETDYQVFAAHQISGNIYTSTGGRIYMSSNKGLTWAQIYARDSWDISTFAVDPQSSAIIYAGTWNGALFKSTNGGTTWAPLNSGLPTSDNIRFIAVDRSNSSTVYLGTQNHGIMKSSDGGASWSATNNNVAFTRVEDIVMDPVNPSTVYIAAQDAANNQGYYKSTDGGGNWAKLPVNTWINWTSGNDIAIDSTNTNIIYVIFDRSIQKSLDGGASWTEYPVSNAQVNCIVIDPRNPQILYAGTNGAGVFKSANGGVSWTPINNGMRALRTPGGSPHSLAVDKSNPDYVYAGTIFGGYRSSNGGRTWENMGHPQGSMVAILTHPSTPGLVYTSHNSLWISPDYGRSGTWVDPGNCSLCYFSRGDLGIASDNPNIIYMSARGTTNPQPGIYKSLDGGASWTLKNNGLTNTEILTLTVQPANHDIVYAGTQVDWPLQPGKDYGLFKTVNGGDSWQHITSGLPSGIQVNQISIYQGNPDIMYIAAGANNPGIYKSNDGGNSWWQVSNQDTSAIATVPNNPNLLYAGSWDGFYVSFNGGASWIPLNQGLLRNPRIDSIALDPRNPYHVFIATPSGVYEATFSFSFAITTGPLPAGTLNSAYSQTLQAAGGKTPYTWGIISGSLPAGLGLDGASGVISGTPTTIGTFNFTVQLTDSTFPYPQTVTKDFSIAIGASSGAGYDISGRISLNGSYLSGVVMQGLPGPPMTNSSGDYVANVPPGWSGSVTPILWGYSFDPTSRIYTNVTTALTGQDYAGFTRGALTVMTSQIPSGVKNSPYGFTLQAANGVEPYSWSVSSGSLPGGLTLATSGEISGTPTESGDFSFTVRATDSSSPKQFALQALALQIAPAHLSPWTTTYPYGGIIRPRGLVLDPSAPNTLYATPQFRGIYKSTDGGSQWISITDNLDFPFDKTGIGLLLLRNSNEIYAVSYGGLVKSMDAGRTWTRIDNGITNGVSALALHPTAADILYCGTWSGGIYRTTNGGLGWSNISAGLPGKEIRAIAINPADLTKVYAGTVDSGIYRRANDNSWEQIIGSPARAENIAFDPKNPGTIYVAGNDGSSDGIFETTDGGSTWTKPLDIPVNWQPGYYIAIDPTPGTNIIYVVSYEYVYKSTDGGGTWTASSIPGTALNCIVLDPSHPAILYLGTESRGVFKSVNAGEAWTEINTGIQAVNFPGESAHSLEVDESNSNYLYAGSMEGLRSTDGGITWEKMSYAGWALSLATHPSLPGTVYSFSSEARKSTDRGSNWQHISDAYFSGFGDGDIRITRSNQNILYVGADFPFPNSSSAEGIYKSVDGGTTWLPMNNGLSNRRIHTLAIHPADSNIVFAGTEVQWPTDPATDYGLFKTTDGGQSWRHITCGLPTVLKILQISIYQNNPSIMYLTSIGENNGVYKSTDGGECWTKLLNENANAVAIHPTNPDLVFAGTWNSGGFYLSTNGGQSWAQYNSGLPLNAGIVSISLAPTNPLRVYIGTMGGVYQTLFSLDFMITTGSFPAGKVNAAYSQTFQAAGGATPYTWGIISGALPPGLGLNPSTGVISGTPTAAGTFNFRVRVTDSSPLQNTVTRNFSITIQN